MVDFVVIGAMKAGTSTLYQSLKDHPQIELTKRKEANFFNNKIDDKTVSWYTEQFNERSGMKGDISPNYAKRHIYPNTAQQLFTKSPDAKLIYLVRDPVKRTISHIHHDLLRGRLSSKYKIAEILNKHKDYLLTSSYNYQLQPFSELFAEEQVLVVSFEKLINDPTLTLRKIIRFLGIGNIEEIPLKPGNITEKRYLIPFFDKVRKITKNPVVLKFYHMLWYLINIKIEKPVLDDKDVSLIVREIRVDISRFVERFPGIDLDWSLYHKFDKK